MVNQIDPITGNVVMVDNMGVVVTDGSGSPSMVVAQTSTVGTKCITDYIVVST